MREEYPDSLAAIRIGDIAYSTNYAKPEDVHHITIKNVISRAPYGVMVSNGLKDSVIESVKSDHQPFGIFHRATLENVSIELN